MFASVNPTMDANMSPGEEEEDFLAAWGLSKPAPIQEVLPVPNEAGCPKVRDQRKEGLALLSEEADVRWALDPDPPEPPLFSWKEEEEEGTGPRIDRDDGPKYPVKEPLPPSQELPKKIMVGDTEEKKVVGSCHAAAEKDQDQLPCSPVEDRSLGKIPQPSPEENPRATGETVPRDTAPKNKHEIPTSSSFLKETVLRTETKAWLPKEDSLSSTMICTKPKLPLRQKDKSCHKLVAGSPSFLKEAVTGSTSAMVNSLNSFVESPVGQVFANTIERVLQKSEEWLNYYLPSTENCEVPSGTSEERHDTSFQDLCKEGCFVRINSLSTQLRNRAFKYILHQLKATRQSTQENLSLLDQVLDLVVTELSSFPNSPTVEPEPGGFLAPASSGVGDDPGGEGSLLPRRHPPGSEPLPLVAPLGKLPLLQEIRAGARIEHSGSIAPTTLVKVPEKLSSMWAHWTTDQEPEGSRLPRRQKCDSISFVPEQLELKALSLTRILARELYTTYHNLLPHIPDLPVHLQEKASRVYESLEELQSQLSKSPSLRDLPAHLIVHSRQKITNARENLDEILDFMAENSPSQWLSPASSSKAVKEPLFGESSKSPEPRNREREKDEENAMCHTTPPPSPPPPPPHL